MTRPLVTATANSFDLPILPLALIVYLDVLNDPLLAWSGIGDLVFTAAQTGDANLDAKTFKGTGSIIEVSSISEGAGGSDAVEISLPGVDIDLEMMRQLIRDRRRWQFRRAVVWGMTLDPDTNAIVGKPFRLKTGRMDKFPYTESKEGLYKCSIEGQQAYGNIALATRYSEQRDINPNDVSQTYVHSLANMTATIGQNSSGVNSAATGSGIGTTAGGGGGFRSNVGRQVSF
jgi:hypothetical protein